MKSLPSLPLLSDVLSNFELTIPTPRLGGIDDPDGNAPPRFIESATVSGLPSIAKPKPRFSDLHTEYLTCFLA